MKVPKRILVCGGRNWTDGSIVLETLKKFCESDSVIVHGGATGADMMAGNVARALRLPVEVHQAEWGKYGRRAGPIRNQKMLDSGVDLVVAFWDGVSRGTADMIRRSREAGVDTVVILKKPDNPEAKA